MLTFLKKPLSSLFNYLVKEVAGEKFLICIVYSLFYLILVSMCAYFDKATRGACITVTGSVVSIIFTAWTAGNKFGSLPPSVNTNPGTPD